MPPQKKAKRPTPRPRPTEITGDRIRFDDKTNTYRHGPDYVNFESNASRVWDVPDAFLSKAVAFEILSHERSVITLGNPRSTTGRGAITRGIRLRWVLSRFDRAFATRCSDADMARIIRELDSTRCDAECLRGISFSNPRVGDVVTIHVDGSAVHEICEIMGKEPRPAYKRAADLLNLGFKGHRSNGDSVVRASDIDRDDLQTYVLLVREGIMKAEKLDGQQFLVTAEVDEAERSIVGSLRELAGRFEGTKEVAIENDPRDRGEALVPEQLSACRTAMNNPVSYITGFPGTGKTSALCRLLRESDGTVILTPSHVSREVVRRRALANGIDPSTFSVEVLAFAVRHTREWLPGGRDEERQVTQRSRDFMEKFTVAGEGEGEGDGDGGGGGGGGGARVETLVIEEASMCDVFQAARVIAAFCELDSLKRLVLCGDHRQLQSVSKGRVLQDFIDCESIPGTTLTVNHRSGSALSTNLRHILESSVVDMESDETFQVLTFLRDGCVVEEDRFGRNRVLALQPTVDLYRLNRERGLTTHVFAYTNVEVRRINEAIRESVFGASPLPFPDSCKVRVVDPDLVSPPHFHRNDFIEVVTNLGNKSFLAKRWGVVDPGEPLQFRVTGRLRDALSLGYCSSIHAFQGSECDHVIVHAIPNCAYFSRDALYTACSRGKKSCVLVTCRTSWNNFERIVRKPAVPRLSNLSHRLSLSLSSVN